MRWQVLERRHMPERRVQVQEDVLWGLLPIQRGGFKSHPVLLHGLYRDCGAHHWAILRVAQNDAIQCISFTTVHL